MIGGSRQCGHAHPWTASAVGIVLLSPCASFADGVYNPINPTMADKIITLTGHDLTIDQVIQVARYGAKVQLSPEARQREADNYGLLLEAATEGVPVYWFNRGAGTNRQVHLFDGDPLDPNNKMKDGRTVKEYLEQTLLEWFKDGAYAGDPPEILDEDIVRAVMVVRANAMTFDAPSPQVSQMLIDMLNKRITPVMMARASTGSTDMEQTETIAAPMVGAGDCYYHGRRMPSMQALQQASLRPIQPFAADDNELSSSNAYSTAVATFIAFEGEQALQWADLTYAIDLNGMNSPTAPLSYLVQTNRPFKWVNWDANRVKEMLHGSYLFNADAKRVIQDPESIRAAVIRQGTAWQMWAQLRDDVVTQLNSSDHNPAIRAGLSPQDSWELQTPEIQKYFVKGGKYSTKSGFILANANWDPFPIAVDLEAFTLAVAELDLTLMLRIERFGSPFFTQVDDEDPVASLSRGDEGFIGYEVWQDIQALIAPVMPEGYGGNTSENEELESQTRIRAQHARAVVDDTFRLLSDDLLNGARWLDARKEQDRSRTFGPGPTAAWEAFRKVVPSRRTPLNGYGDIPKRGRDGEVAYKFLKANPASTFVPLKEVEVGKF